MKVGVLALQGATEAHERFLVACGATTMAVRNAEQLAAVDALVLPGGESTTMSMLLARTGLEAPLADRLESGLPVLGTCAGMILLAERVVDGRPDQHGFGAVPMTVQRNGYGRQRESFETDLTIDGGPPLAAVFIRAPRVVAVDPTVEVLAELDGDPVWCRHRRVMVTAFHPELSEDHRVHQAFLALVRD